ncbi:3-keto-5-aminohexanoate cleavage protein [Streptosporangium sp. NBC_01810]|uniref:3-keto-5-aminohexanoate cleavage protein n=1 Tax=Streptosporangium sp. NBC_01810 TaxID=2975951 RepID=UPI003FA38071
MVGVPRSDAPRPEAGEEGPWLKACLNGARRPGDQPALPVTPPQLAEAAREAREAGAGAVHMHPRDEAGSESLSAVHIGAAVRAVRAACPGLPVGVSTGLWITGGDVDARRAAVRGRAGGRRSRPGFCWSRRGGRGRSRASAWRTSSTAPRVIR